MSDRALRFEPADEGDFEALLALRVAAMREGVERVGRHDPQTARERLGRSFSPSRTQHIVCDGQRVGFLSVARDVDPWLLDHLYIDPAMQGRGLGGWALTQLMAEADRAGRAIAVTALTRSDARRFWARHGFVLVGQSEWDSHYLRAAPAERAAAAGDAAGGGMTGRPGGAR